MEKKVVIDAGHGGTDSGASANGIIEKDINLKISKYMYDRFKELGIDTALTRDSDVTLSPSVRPSKVQNFFGKGNDVIVISNHVNAGGGDGAEVIYALRNNDTLSRLIANELESAGQNFRKYYQRRLPSNPTKDYYYLLRDTPNNETIIVEYGFVDSKGNDVSLLKNNWEDLAEAVVKAVTKYIGVNYYPKSNNTYVVKSGDSLWSIAKKNNTTIDNLKKINNLNSNLIKVGQVLNLDTNTYIVQKGDTLYSIAKKNNTSVDKLKTTNNLNSNLLSIGQVLKI